VIESGDGISMFPLRLEGNLLGYRTPLPTGAPPVDRGLPNPHPERLRWDASKQAFRLIEPSTHCNCRNQKSAFGEKVTCGLCDRRKQSPRRFQPEVDDRREPRCGYCGELTGKQTRICGRCEQIKERLLVDGITEDDQILRGIQRVLAAANRRRLSEAEVEEIRQQRKANRLRARRRVALAA
jgi:hypothetical protein